MKKLTAITTILLLLTQISAQAAWTYVENEGNKTVNGQNYPYTGTISDGNWEIYVYRPVEGSDEFYLGTGGKGYSARIAGSGELDLSTLYEDTLAAGTPVKIVNVAKSAFYNIGGNLTELYLPNTVTNIGYTAFERCDSLKSLDLSNTKIRSIQGFAFCWGQSLTEIWLPETLEYIGACAFRTMPGSGVVHFAGDVPFLERTSETNIYGTQFWPYVSQGHFQNVFCGSNGKQWAFCVNAEKYPNWKNLRLTSLYNEENPFPTGENNWIPQKVRYTTNSAYQPPFANTMWTRTTDTDKNGRIYLIQEGTSDGVQKVRPMIGDVTVVEKRYSIEHTVPVFVGAISSPVTVTYTLGDMVTTRQISEDTVLVFSNENLPESTTYDYTIVVEGTNGYDTWDGTVNTVTPDIVLGDFSYELTKDGKTVTFTAVVDVLLTETGTLSLTMNSDEVVNLTIDKTGTYTFVQSLQLGTDYTCTLVGAAGVDTESKSVEFFAERYKWVYTPGAGKNNSQPYTGTITDKNWVLYVYQPDENSNDFYLGCGGRGAGAIKTGSGILDLTQLLDDTTLDGYAVNVVNVANYAFRNANIESITLPNNVTNIGVGAFSGVMHKKVDFTNTKLQSIEKWAFEWNMQLNEVWLPKTLKRLGACAFIVLPNNGVAHFMGDVPVLETTSTTDGTNYAPYVGGNMDKYRNFDPGENDRWVFCVDNKLYPAWNNVTDTTHYTDENPFPTSENDWIPQSVRYTVNSNYKAPFAKTLFGREGDTAKDSRTYLVYEKHGELATILFIR